MKFRFAHSLVATSLVLGGACAMLTSPAFAQTTGAARAQVKMDRDAFLAMARWDEIAGQWVIRDDMPMPAGLASRAEIKAMRDKFLSMNTWDENGSTYVPVKGAPRDMSKLSRAQVKMETERYLKMYRFDEPTSTFVLRSR
jgi:hypothetical protein